MIQAVSGLKVLMSTTIACASLLHAWQRRPCVTCTCATAARLLSDPRLFTSITPLLRIRY
jgi:hypothetical protein